MGDGGDGRIAQLVEEISRDADMPAVAGESVGVEAAVHQAKDVRVDGDVAPVEAGKSAHQAVLQHDRVGGAQSDRPRIPRSGIHPKGRVGQGDGVSRLDSDIAGIALVGLTLDLAVDEAQLTGLDLDAPGMAAQRGKGGVAGRPDAFLPLYDLRLEPADQL